MSYQSLEDRIILFSCNAIKLAESLPETFSFNYLKHQLIRSASSPCLNYGEAQGAESKRDFLHKMKICLKEFRECLVIFKMLERLSNSNEVKPLKQECNELVSIFVASCKTASRTS